jgi:hypothetical protein
MRASFAEGAEPACIMVATFLRIDEDLLAVAAAASSREVDAPTAELERWLTTISRP